MTEPGPKAELHRCLQTAPKAWWESYRSRLERAGEAA